MCFPNLRGDLPNDPTNQPIRVVPLTSNGTKPGPFGNPYGPPIPLVREANHSCTSLSATRTGSTGPTDSEGKARTSSAIPKSVWRKGPMSETEYKQAKAREAERKSGEKERKDEGEGVTVSEAPVHGNRTGNLFVGDFNDGYKDVAMGMSTGVGIW